MTDLGRSSPGGPTRKTVNTDSDVFAGPAGAFAAETAQRARVALACTEQGEPLPAWSGREYVAVALVLADGDRIEAEGFHSLLAAVRYVADGMATRFGTVGEAQAFFAAIRARVDGEAFAAAWDRIARDL